MGADDHENATLNVVSGVAASPDGSAHISGTGHNRVRKVAPSGIISTAACGSTCLS